jgi:hypothetical protein
MSLMSLSFIPFCASAMTAQFLRQLLILRDIPGISDGIERFL